MKAMMAISAGCVILGLGFLLFNRSSGGKMSATEETSSETPARAPPSLVVRERPEKAAAAEESKYVSLDLFGRPYMRTLGESDLSKLSPEDRDKAMAETMDSGRQVRNHVFDVVAQAKAGIENGDHAKGEAYLISALETGRDVNANRDGLVTTRLVGFSCQKVALNEMVSLYTKVGEQAKLRVAQQRLRDIDAEVNDLRDAAQASNWPAPPNERTRQRRLSCRTRRSRGIWLRI